MLQSCNLTDKKVDIVEASKLVTLNSSDLETFSQLRQQLLSDSVAIKKQNDETTALVNRTSWMITNSYYLNQIDSTKYSILFLKLKGKLLDDIRINKFGSIIFTIKENTQMNTGNYNETYSHQLISTDYNYSIKTVFNNIDTVFVDSTINKDWKYTFYKALTGH
jgi:hypothetical protein